MLIVKRLFALSLAILLAPLAYAAEAVSPLVAPTWLAENLERQDLVVLDTRSGSGSEGSGLEVYQQGHIPSAIHSSYATGGWRTTVDGVIAKLPPVEQLTALIGELGISNEDHVIIVYAGTDSTDFGSAARVYWTFKVLGHDRVSILDGGQGAWTAAGLPLSTEAVQRAPRDFVANFRPQMVASTEQVAAALEKDVQLVDARPHDQFLGRGKHPQARAAGTIPGALNLEEAQMVQANSSPVDRETVTRLAHDAGLEVGQPVITFCNTGHWAATSWFMLSEVGGYEQVVMYDGSMVEWAADEQRPLQTERRGLGRLLQFFQ